MVENSLKSEILLCFVKLCDSLVESQIFGMTMQKVRTFWRSKNMRLRQSFADFGVHKRSLRALAPLS